MGASLGMKRQGLIAVFYRTDISGKEHGACFAIGSGDDPEGARAKEVRCRRGLNRDIMLQDNRGAGLHMLG